VCVVTLWRYFHYTFYSLICTAVKMGKGMKKVRPVRAGRRSIGLRYKSPYGLYGVK